MDFNTTLDIIIKDLREAREIIDDLKHYPGVPAIQVELAKSKCKSAEDIISLLKTMKQEYQVAGKEEVVKVVEAVEVVEVVAVVEAEEVVKVVEVVEVVNEEVAVKVEEELKQSAAEIFSLEEETAGSKKTKNKTAEKNIVADRFSDMPETFNEQLGNKTGDGDISNLNKSRPVINLIDAIGINDKFLFVREIFNGNQLSYNEAITKLNNTNNLADAKAVIMSYTGEGDENNAVKQLLDLVKRKLPANE